MNIAMSVVKGLRRPRKAPRAVNDPGTTTPEPPPSAPGQAVKGQLQLSFPTPPLDLGRGCPRSVVVFGQFAAVQAHGRARECLQPRRADRVGA